MLFGAQSIFWNAAAGFQVHLQPRSPARLRVQVQAAGRGPPAQPPAAGCSQMLRLVFHSEYSAFLKFRRDLACYTVAAAIRMYILGLTVPSTILWCTVPRANPCQPSPLCASRRRATDAMARSAPRQCQGRGRGRGRAATTATAPPQVQGCLQRRAGPAGPRPDEK